VRENVADRKYIFFCLKKQFEYLNRLGTGSTFRQIRRNNIENCPIPLPPLPVQKKIAAILDKADQARRKRQETLRLTDQFLQAAFLEMFGNPVTNPNGWEVRKFGDYVDLVTSGSRGWARYYADSGAKFIRVQNLTNHKLTLSDMAFVKPPDSSETERTRVQPNDVLISITGVVGLSAVVPQDIGEAYISQHVALARLKGNLNPMFASYFISNRLGGQLQFKKFQYGQTKPGLNLNQIRDLRIYVPSLAEQEKFAALVDRVEAFHERQRESEQELETLFQSLMQKAFK
jgi:type I restriction enzyme S subunit